MARDLAGSNPAPLAVLVNPAAGRGRAQRRARLLATELQRVGLPFAVRTSAAPGDLRQMAAEAQGGVIVVGGDGTVSEVVDGLVPRDGRLGPLAILASGSGDDFAASAGFPTAPADLVEHLRRWLTSEPSRPGAAASTPHPVANDDPDAPRSPHERLVDVGQATIDCEHGRLQRRFANNLGLGFEAQVVLAAERTRWLRGRLLYLVATLRALRRQQLVACKLTSEGPNGPTVEDVSLLFCSACNGRRVGGGLPFAPTAQLDDGWLDVLRVTSASRRRTLLLLGKLVGGRHLGDERVQVTRCRSLVIEPSRPIAVVADGDALAMQATTIRLQLARERLRLIGA